MDHRVHTPQVIGHGMAGTIESVGEGVGEWKPGDRVTVMPLDPCGDCPACKAGHSHVCMKLKFIGIDVPGALQTLWTVPAHTLLRVPDELSLTHAARVALRMGAEQVKIVYRRSRRESPARVEELEHAMEEGVEFHWLTTPVEIMGSSEGWVTGMRCQKMELGEPDSSGRRRPVPVEGSEFDMAVDTVIYALGTSANPIISQTTPGLKINKYGYIDVDEATNMSSLPGVFAGGDIVTGAATVILAMGAGRRAARGMLAYMGFEV